MLPDGLDEAADEAVGHGGVAIGAAADDQDVHVSTPLGVKFGWRCEAGDKRLDVLPEAAHPALWCF
jgi:hypothetical protein